MQTLIHGHDVIRFASTDCSAFDCWKHNNCVTATSTVVSGWTRPHWKFEVATTHNKGASLSDKSILAWTHLQSHGWTGAKPAIVSLDGSWSCPWLGNWIDPESDARCSGRQHSKKHSQTQLLLNEIRDLHANVPCRSDLHPSQCRSHEILTFNQCWRISLCLRPIVMNPSVSCFQTKLHENMFQFRTDFLKWFSVLEEFMNQGIN